MYKKGSRQTILGHNCYIWSILNIIGYILAIIGYIVAISCSILVSGTTESGLFIFYQYILLILHQRWKYIYITSFPGQYFQRKLNIYALLEFHYTHWHISISNAKLYISIIVQFITNIFNIKTFFNQYWYWTSIISHACNTDKILGYNITKITNNGSLIGLLHLCSVLPSCTCIERKIHWIFAIKLCYIEAAFVQFLQCI